MLGFNFIVPRNERYSKAQPFVRRAPMHYMRRYVRESHAGTDQSVTSLSVVYKERLGLTESKSHLVLALIDIWLLPISKDMITRNNH